MKCSHIQGIINCGGGQLWLSIVVKEEVRRGGVKEKGGNKLRNEKVGTQCGRKRANERVLLYDISSAVALHNNHRQHYQKIQAIRDKWQGSRSRSETFFCSLVSSTATSVSSWSRIINKQFSFLYKKKERKRI